MANFIKSNLLRIVKWLTFGAALLIIADVVYRMTLFGTSTDPYFFILTFYLIGFAFLLGVAEVRVKKIIAYIEFMRGRLGKGFYIIVIGLLIFNTQRIPELVFSCIIIFIGLINVIASCFREKLKEEEQRRDLNEDEGKRKQYFEDKQGEDEEEEDRQPLNSKNQRYHADSEQN